MKFNLCTVALATIAAGVSAHPSVGNKAGAANGAVVRQEGKGAVGTVFRRASLWGGSNSPPSFARDDEDDDSDDDSDDRDDRDDSDDSSSSGAVGGYTYPTATQTSVLRASATGSSSGSETTGSGSSSGSSGSGGSLPASSGTSALDAVQTIASGESFDGGMVMYDRGVSCSDGEGGDSDAVFQIENGGTLKNVIIGPNQIEGVHCQGSCTLENVWWSAVCEDAFSIKIQEASETTTVTGGGAYGAEDKVMQHNGGGSLTISDFVVEDFGKLYRSCGNCDSMVERHVTISGVTATNGDLIAGINSNYGDSATISGITASGVEEICEQFEGNESGDEPTSVGTGNDGTYCIIQE